MSMARSWHADSMAFGNHIPSQRVARRLHLDLTSGSLSGDGGHETELSPKQILAVRCPTCGAVPGEKCELGTGQLRTTPHRDRRLTAKDHD
jgi:hypothetical protein